AAHLEQAVSAGHEHQRIGSRAQRIGGKSGPVLGVLQPDQHRLALLKRTAARPVKHNLGHGVRPVGDIAGQIGRAQPRPWQKLVKSADAAAAAELTASRRSGSLAQAPRGTKYSAAGCRLRTGRPSSSLSWSKNSWVEESKVQAMSSRPSWGSRFGTRACAISRSTSALFGVTEASVGTEASARTAGRPGGSAGKYGGARRPSGSRDGSGGGRLADCGAAGGRCCLGASRISACQTWRPKGPRTITMADGRVRFWLTGSSTARISEPFKARYLAVCGPSAGGKAPTCDMISDSRHSAAWASRAECGLFCLRHFGSNLVASPRCSTRDLEPDKPSSMISSRQIRRECSCLGRAHWLLMKSHSQRTQLFNRFCVLCGPPNELCVWARGINRLRQPQLQQLALDYASNRLRQPQLQQLALDHASNQLRQPQLQQLALNYASNRLRQPQLQQLALDHASNHKYFPNPIKLVKEAAHLSDWQSGQVAQHVQCSQSGVVVHLQGGVVLKVEPLADCRNCLGLVAVHQILVAGQVFSYAKQSAQQHLHAVGVPQQQQSVQHQHHNVLTKRQECTRRRPTVQRVENLRLAEMIRQGDHGEQEANRGPLQVDRTCTPLSPADSRPCEWYTTVFNSSGCSGGSMSSPIVTWPSRRAESRAGSWQKAGRGSRRPRPGPADRPGPTPRRSRTARSQLAAESSTGCRRLRISADDDDTADDWMTGEQRSAGLGMRCSTRNQACRTVSWPSSLHTSCRPAVRGTFSTAAASGNDCGRLVARCASKLATAPSASASLKVFTELLDRLESSNECWRRARAVSGVIMRDFSVISTHFNSTFLHTLIAKPIVGYCSAAAAAKNVPCAAASAHAAAAAAASSINKRRRQRRLRRAKLSSRTAAASQVSARHKHIEQARGAVKLRHGRLRADQQQIKHESQQQSPLPTDTKKTAFIFTEKIWAELYAGLLGNWTNSVSGVRLGRQRRPCLAARIKDRVEKPEKRIRAAAPKYTCHPGSLMPALPEKLRLLSLSELSEVRSRVTEVREAAATLIGSAHLDRLEGVERRLQTMLDSSLGQEAVESAEDAALMLEFEKRRRKAVEENGERAATAPAALPETICLKKLRYRIDGLAEGVRRMRGSMETVGSARRLRALLTIYTGFCQDPGLALTTAAAASFKSSGGMELRRRSLPSSGDYKRNASSAAATTASAPSADVVSVEELFLPLPALTHRFELMQLRESRSTLLMEIEQLRSGLQMVEELLTLAEQLRETDCKSNLRVSELAEELKRLGFCLTSVTDEEADAARVQNPISPIMDAEAHGLDWKLAGLNPKIGRWLESAARRQEFVVTFHCLMLDEPTVDSEPEGGQQALARVEWLIRQAKLLVFLDSEEAGIDDEAPASCLGTGLEAEGSRVVRLRRTAASSETISLEDGDVPQFRKSVEQACAQYSRLQQTVAEQQLSLQASATSLESLLTSADELQAWTSEQLTNDSALTVESDESEEWSSRAAQYRSLSERFDRRVRRTATPASMPSAEALTAAWQRLTDQRRTRQTLAVDAKKLDELTAWLETLADDFEALDGAVKNSSSQNAKQSASQRRQANLKLLRQRRCELESSRAFVTELQDLLEKKRDQLGQGD
uniref:SH3_15 domain-containing protein n=1 Tax=Macrostomum lignano TaxID=282301 RepID=A0A1I8I6C5_9PLAT